MKSKFIVFVIVVLILLGAASYFAWRTISVEGSSRLEQWIGESLVSVLHGYINPSVEFDSLDYQAPTTVIIDGWTITAPGGQRMIAAKQATLTLAEIPRTGEPVLIEAIRLEQPELYFIAKPEAGGAAQPAGEETDGADGGGFIGWSDFVREGVLDERRPEPGRRLSDVLRMRHVEIDNAQLVYDVGDGSEPMRLENVTFTLNTPPAGDEPGWYAIVGQLQRDDLFSLDIDGRVNLDTIELALDDLALTMALGEESYGTLPPQLQTTLREHEVRGQLVAEVAGSIPLTDWMNSNATVNARLGDAFVSFEEYVLPVALANIHVNLSDGSLTGDYEASLLDGNLSGELNIGLEDPRPAEVTWTANGIAIEETLRVVTQGRPKYAGKLNSTGRATTQLSTAQESLAGQGELHLRDGRLALLPVISDIVERISGEALNIGGGYSDTADVEFVLRPEFARITSLALEAAVVAARGEGRVFYDGRLDLSLNAGPLEKVESALGEIGAVIGAVTDQLMKYNVAGTIQEPVVAVQPLGLGR